MKRICQLLFLIFASFLATLAFAIEGGSTPPTGSTQVTPPANPQVRIDCPQFTVSGQTVNSTNPPIPIRLGDVNDIVCTSGYSGGGVAIIGGVIGGQFDPFCPANMPYLGGFTETGVAVGPQRAEHPCQPFAVVCRNRKCPLLMPGKMGQTVLNIFVFESCKLPRIVASYSS